jgi:hypothetical protein
MPIRAEMGRLKHASGGRGAAPGATGPNRRRLCASPAKDILGAYSDAVFSKTSLLNKCARQLINRQCYKRRTKSGKSFSVLFFKKEHAF